MEMATAIGYRHGGRSGKYPYVERLITYRNQWKILHADVSLSQRSTATT